MGRREMGTWQKTISQMHYGIWIGLALVVVGTATYVLGGCNALFGPPTVQALMTQAEAIFKQIDEQNAHHLAAMSPDAQKQVATLKGHIERLKKSAAFKELKPDEQKIINKIFNALTSFPKDAAAAAKKAERERRDFERQQQRQRREKDDKPET